jgi:hypothetical protein
VTKEPALTKKTPHPKVVEQPVASKTPEPSGEALVELTNDQWATILAKINNVSSPLQSVLRQAEPHFDASSQTLTLKFKYQLHRKRADTAQAKSALAQIMVLTLGSAPAIATELDTGATAPKFAQVETPPAPLDDTAQSVAAIMGGGEPIAA